MKKTVLHLPGMRRDRDRAFSLIEIALALAIISIAMVAIVGVLPAGLSASRDAVNHTVIAGILEEVHQRLQNEKLVTGNAAFSPAFFDEQGIFIPRDAEPAELVRRVYRADVRVQEWSYAPAHTSSLRPVTVELSWPVDADGEATGAFNPRTTATYAVTAMSGPDWGAIDRTYTPRIEF